jgi:PAS domain S-box-containing protein
MFRLTLKVKFAILLVGIIFSLVFLITSNFKTSRETSDMLGHARDQALPRFVGTNRILDLFDEITRTLNSAVVSQDQQALSRADEKRTELVVLLNELETMVQGQELSRVRRIRLGFNTYYEGARRQVVRALSEEDTIDPNAGNEIESLANRLVALEDDLMILRQEARREMRSNLDEAVDVVRQNALQNRIVGLLAGLMLTVLIVFIVLRIINAISKLSQIVSSIGSSGSLARVDFPHFSNDEIGDLAASLRNMVVALDDTMISKGYLDDIVESLADMLVVVKSDLTIERFNRALCEQLGHRDQDLLGKHIGLLIPDEAIQHLGADPLQKGVYRPSFDTVMFRKDGSSVPVAFSNSTMYGKEGSKRGIVCLARDVSNRRKIERELIEARDAAESAARAKSQFLANMSHEIRTPLNGVLGMAQILMGAQLRGSERECVEIIYDSAENLLRMINEILDYSRIDADKLELKYVEFNLRSCLEGTIELLQEKAVRKNLELHLILDHRLPRMFKGDPGRLRQILLNLIGNGIKFTEQGQVVTRVFAVEEQENLIKVCFQVVDTGIGIAREEREKLFLPFSQLDDSDTRRFGGAGLGLAVANRLVAAMGGNIELESIKGKGATFSFTLAFRKLAGKQLPSSIPEQLRQARILLFSPRVQLVDSLRENLHPLETLIAPDLEIARELLSQASELPQIVLADGNLRDEMILLTREYSGKDETKPFFCLKLATGDDQEEIGAPFDQNMLLPIKRVTLLRTLEQALISFKEDTQPKEEEKTELVDTHILLVEDNPVNQKVTMRFLEKKGYRCDIAANGLEALEQMKKRDYDLILMDCNMPEMDGYEATREIRKRQQGGTRTPIVALTANIQEGDEEKCYAAGMDGYLGKPLKVRALYEMLDRFLSKVK